MSSISIIYTGRSVDAARQQVELQERGQITDRFARAVEQLGAEQTSVRLGAIYALERIMRDSPADQPAIIEVLCGFVRDRSPNKGTSYDPYEFSWAAFTEKPWVRRLPPTDIQAAVTVLGRRDSGADGGTIVDLSGAHLDGATFVGHFQRANLTRSSLVKANLWGDFEKADFTESDLAGAKATGRVMTAVTLKYARLDQADFSYAHLERSDLSGISGSVVNLRFALLAEADLSDARMHGAGLQFAQLQSALLRRADLSRASFGPANVQAADFEGADLRGANFIETNNMPHQLNCVKVDEQTRLRSQTTVSQIDCATG
ncbi:uncharacterized protein YjbI with pentapeptide repeats [Micromonospora sp. A202]|nr:uncharacterized protein YjbI with pentapeptide repeats [Micromonospora sp. A202]